MKWVTFQDNNGVHTGVLSGDVIHPVQPGVSLLDLIGRGATGLREAGEEALRSASGSHGRGICNCVIRPNFTAAPPLATAEHAQV